MLRPDDEPAEFGAERHRHRRSRADRLMLRRLLLAAAVLLSLILGLRMPSPGSAETNKAVGAHKLTVAIAKSLPPAAEKKLAVLVLISLNGGAPAGAVATPSKALIVLLDTRRIYRVEAEVDSSCRGGCSASYRISGSASHKLQVVPDCQLKRSGFVCSKIVIVKVY